MVESAAAASYAGDIKLLSSGKLNPDSKKMLLLTGNGLKDISSIEKSNLVPEIKLPAEWMNELLLKNRLIS